MKHTAQTVTDNLVASLTDPKEEWKDARIPGMYHPGVVNEKRKLILVKRNGRADFDTWPVGYHPNWEQRHQLWVAYQTRVCMTLDNVLKG
jgi:hypothetical protein